jgi:hypothetical protein
MSHHQATGQNHNLKMANISFENMAKLKYFMTNKNDIHKEIKSILNLRNACYHYAQDVLSSHLLSKKAKIRIYRSIIYLLLFMGMKLGLSP